MQSVGPEWAISFTAKARRYYERVSPDVARRLDEALDALSADPYGCGARPVRGHSGR